MHEDIKIVRLNNSDLERFIELIRLFNEVFEEYHCIGPSEHLNKLLSKSDFHAIIALRNDIMVGGLTAYELNRYYSDKSELYIYDIAVKTKFHNQGIGKKLISYLKDYGVKNEIETIFVEAHSEDEQAVKFYESTFGVSEKVDHFNFNIKK